jgi:hypothetical protein
MVNRLHHEAPDRWYYLLFLTTLAVTPVCYLAVYANWSMPLLSAPFFDTFRRISWLRISFILTTVTFLFPYCGLYRAKDPQRTAEFCAIVYGGTLLPCMILATYPGLETLGRSSDPQILYLFILIIALHATVAGILARRLARDDATI